MFNTTAYLLNRTTERSTSFGAEYDVIPAARRLYFQARQGARIADWLARLAGHQPRHLTALRSAITGRRIANRHAAGVQTVAVCQIRGSVDRADDFDADWRPLANSTQQRWLRVATARAQGQALPPVALIKFGQDYFVQDGHHRISVAQARGEMEIEAEVVEWDD